MTSSPPPNGRFAWDILWVGLLALYAFAGYALAPFHGDESMQIFMSRDYAYHFIDGDTAKLAYDPSNPLDLEQNLRMINGTVNKYTIGLAWHLAGFTAEQLNVPWYWDEDVATNREIGAYPSDGLLLAARVPSALFLAGSVVLWFLVMLHVAGRPAAYAGVAYYALHPAVLLNGRRAMMEGGMLFGAAATVFAALMLVSRERRGVWAAVLAVAAGLAVASKHTNAVTVAGVFVGVGLHALFGRTTARAALLGWLVAAGVGALAVFYALNPAWWGQPVTVAQAVLDERVALLAGQTETFGGYPNTGAQLVGMFQQVFIGRPMYYEIALVRDDILPQIATYEATVYAGIYAPGSAAVLVAAFVVGALTLVGVVRLPDVNPSARWVVGAWAFVTVVTLTLTTPLAWQRYYLLIFPVVATVAPLGVIAFIRWFVGDAADNSPQYKRGSARVVK
jgi:4-amino-4-deoxy-L-arabinose transferase-like glycosyltransferase